jgi:hypothetical protein
MIIRIRLRIIIMNELKYETKPDEEKINEKEWEGG